MQPMKPIILDTDPGIDDALALFLALASHEIRLEAITTVSGNVSVDLTTRNALALLELAGRTDIPVARGCSRPLVREAVYADHVHGSNGLGGVVLPTPTVEPVKQHAVGLMIEKVLQAPGEITLVAIGPLTNIALALRLEPRIAQSVREVVVMGGALRVPGNVRPSVEFNMFCDPHAAHIVFHAGWPIRLVTLDVTTLTLLRREQVQALARRENSITRFLAQASAYYLDGFGAAHGITAFQMHDPLCLAAAFQPELLSWQPAYVDVELTGTLTWGQTVGYFKQPPASPNVLAAVGVDAERFMRLFLERMQNPGA